MSILKEYITHQNHYSKIYNESVVIMMEVGSFFEMYAIPDPMNEEKYIGADIYNICELLNIQVTKRNKMIAQVNEDNFLMAGFPNHAVKKFIDLLVDNKYIVVLIEQVTPPPKIIRKPTHIYSPSTHIDNLKSHHANYMMSIYIEQIKSISGKPLFVVGWSVFDPSTGSSYTNEITNEEDFRLLMDELYRLVLQYDPKEIVLLSLPNMHETEKIYSHLSDNGRYWINKLNCMNDMYTKLKFQINVLEKVFKNTGMLSMVEYLHLEFKPFALISYAYLIQFAYEHNENFLEKMGKPIIPNDNDNYLTLAYNAVNQLNIVGGTISIESIYNRCCTSLGKRYFRELLLSPITNIDELSDRYHKTKVMLDHKAWVIGDEMKNIKDIERLIRKAITSKLHPHQLSCLYSSMLIIHNTFQKLMVYPEINDTFFTGFEQEHFSNFLTHCEKRLNFVELEKYNIETIKTNIFKCGVYPELDNIYIEIEKCKNKFHDLLNTVNDNWLKLEYNERDGLYFSITNKRWIQLKSEKHAVTSDLKQFGSNSNQIKLSNPMFQNANQILQKLDNDAKLLSTKLYNEFMIGLINGFNETLFKPYIKKIRCVDFHICCAKNAVDYNLTQPNIVAATESFFEFEELRHPIVEQVQKNVQYTSNSISLGKQDQELGLILYGVNASGKSSFMKSIGVNIILAQTGMFVSCTKMSYSPYKQLFTRILSSDNIVKGMSTFANEIYEIRNILKKADNNSIVIGDELCSGTESVSAISIIMAGILALIKSNTTFIFATHLHELNNLERLKHLKENKKLTVKHLKVIYDESNERLVYDRKLSDGPGSSLYGLEVCKSMDMDCEFLHNASLIRHEIVKEPTIITSPTLSKHNSDVILDRCKVCKENHGLETHHIEFQKYADENGMIKNTFHKNSKYNLVVLCNECHNKVHSNNLLIYGWKQTSDGVILDYKERASCKLDIDFICKTRKTNTLKKTLEILKSNDIHLSAYKLRQILKENI